MWKHCRWSCFLYSQSWFGGHLYRNQRWGQRSFSSFCNAGSRDRLPSQVEQDSPRSQNQLNNVKQIQYVYKEFFGLCKSCGYGLCMFDTPFRLLNFLYCVNVLYICLNYQSDFIALKSCQCILSHWLNIPVTVMLTAFLFSPSLSSHQYPPLSDEKAGLMVPDPADVTQLEVFVGMISVSVLITFHSPEPSDIQLKEMDSYSKNCNLFGTIWGKAAPKKRKRFTF